MYTHAHTHACTRAHAHSRTHTCIRAHTHSRTPSWALITGHCLLQTFCKWFQTFFPPKDGESCKSWDQTHLPMNGLQLRKYNHGSIKSRDFTPVLFSLLRVMWEMWHVWSYLPSAPNPRTSGFTLLSSTFLPLDRQRAMTPGFSMESWPQRGMWPDQSHGQTKERQAEVQLPVTFSFYLEFKPQKVTKLFGRYTLHPAPARGVEWGCYSETGHCIRGGRYYFIPSSPG